MKAQKSQGHEVRWPCQQRQSLNRQSLHSTSKHQQCQHGLATQSRYHESDSSPRWTWPWRLLTLFLIASSGCHKDNDPPTADTSTAITGAAYTTATAAVTSELATAEQVQQFCGNCHAFPMPDSFPKDAWYDEVRRGFQFYYDSGRTDLKPPSQTSVVKYYQQLAPKHLETPSLQDSVHPEINFQRIDVQINRSSQQSSEPPAISFLATSSATTIAPDDDDATRPRNTQTDTSTHQIQLSDMRSGWVAQFDLTARLDLAADTFGNSGPTDSPAISNIDASWHFQDVAISPASIRTVSLTGNSARDLLIADLGSFQPEDHDRGKVVLIPDGAGPNPGQAVSLLQGIGRVADVHVADFDNNGLPDIVVAEFGWHATGGIHVLLATETCTGPESFSHLRLDDRPGAIHAIPHDFNRDGRTDIIALLSQEHEQIVVYINQPDGTFIPTTVHAAPDPSWGSSGILLYDMDHDADMDIVYTNGDTFDSYVVKPYHGICWLENKGDLQFIHHTVGALPGVHRAIPADMDGDGDIDIVAAALLPEKTRATIAPHLQQGLVWFEQTSPGTFVRHVIELQQPFYATAVVLDLNGDTRPDILTGMFLESTPPTRHEVRLFLNLPHP